MLNFYTVTAAFYFVVKDKYKWISHPKISIDVLLTCIQIYSQYFQFL